MASTPPTADATPDTTAVATSHQAAEAAAFLVFSACIQCVSALLSS